MKKISLLFAALFCLMTVSAKTIYCKQAQSWWKADGAAVAVHYWGGSSTTWPGIRMTAVEGETDLWSIDIPDNVTGFIFVRVNSSGSIADWGAKTGDLSFQEGKNLYTITSTSPVWGNPGVTGEWSTFTIAATNISLNPTTAEVEEGKTITLTATILPANATDKTITWTSDAETIATVANGVVTGVAEGTATITATTHNGLTATCTVTVKPAVSIAVTSISITPATLELTAGDVSAALEVAVLPENAADKSYTWASDNEAVATVADGIVTAVSKGTANITATANDGSGKVGTCVVTVNPKLYTFTIKVRNNLGWSKMNIYYWGDGVTSPTWPGEEMTQDGDWYVYTFTNAAPSIIINNGGSGDNSQTVDVVGITEDGCYQLGNETTGKRSLVAVDCEGSTPEPEPQEYYLIGYINGVDYGYADDIFNLGDYKFVGDPLQVKAIFTETSYVGVKTSDNANLYWTAAYIDATTSATGQAILAQGNTEKMGISAGEITFTLVENEDGTLTLSFVTKSIATALENATATAMDVRKVVENGTLYIIRNGEKYSVVGTRVK